MIIGSGVLKIYKTVALAAALTGLSSCNGIFGSVYDEPREDDAVTVAGRLYVDASDWGAWYYIDLKAANDATADDASFNPSSLWQRFEIPLTETEQPETGARIPGIYTYWYDVFGEGISKYEPRGFYPTARQPEPENWSFAVHRNNVRTNSAEVARTEFHSFDELPEGDEWIDRLSFEKDEWNEKDVWAIQNKMLLGLIGNQGIEINNTLSSWLMIDIPPMPPAFTHSDNVFVVRFADDTLAALQLGNYQDAVGKKCCLTINYMYPL